MRLLPLESCKLDEPKKAPTSRGSKVRIPVPDNGDGPELMLFAPLPSERSEISENDRKGKKRKA